MNKALKSLSRLAVATVILIGMSSVGFAQKNSGNGNNGNGKKHAPEIDPASATTALALLTGGLLIIRGRRR